MENVPRSKQPVDEGFSWVVCVAAAMVFFVTMGVPKSLGVMLLEFQNHFQSDPSITSLTVALVAAGFFMFVFVSNTFGLLFGNRLTAVCGALLAFVSMFITAFAPNIYFVVVFLGLLSGMAYSALFGPPLIILSAYFVKRRALATGLAVAGGSVGQLSIPLLFNFLVEYYGFKGGMIVFSSVILHAVPACMLLRPPTFYIRKPKLKVVTDANGNSQDIQAAPKAPGCCTKFAAVLKVMLDKELLKSGIFYYMSMCIIFAHLGYFSSVIFIPTCANAFFNNRTLSVILVSVMGVCDLIGRLLGGYIADLKVIRIYDLMGISLAVPGVVTVFAGLFPAIWLMFIAAIFMGVFAGSYAALLTPIIIELFGIKKVSPGFGILTFLMGLFIAPFPTILSFIYKATLTYKSVLAITGAFMALGGFLFFFMRFIVPKKEKPEQAALPEEMEHSLHDKDEEDENEALEKSVLSSTLAVSMASINIQEALDRQDIPEADV